MRARVEAASSCPDASQQRVGRLRRAPTSASGRPLRDLLDEQGQVAGGRRRDDPSGRSTACVAREQLDVGLVLDLLPPGREEGGACVAVGDVAPGTREELRVGLVTAERRHPHPTVVALADEHRAADGLVGGEVQVA